MKFAPLALVAALLAACASGGGGMYDKPYALFEPDQRSVPADTRAAFILKVDGEDRTINRSDPVTPGMRTVVVSVPGARGMSESKHETMTIDAKPCMRYYLAARRPTSTSSDWSPFIAGTEPIGECMKKFKP
ncbi:hypothetical protein LZ009_03350 [Ramlibacter sp. XY19]|uniref:hypothetical protein n=1 Tax=Ramlibacter paludis TaxID=2908000 RepID=UPI0023DB88A8|nr:hypothetical protein [Ramlibacter paludis]MCG2591808.1 hypothetical protein [Ramlibacter paludis]